VFCSGGVAVSELPGATENKTRWRGRQEGVDKGAYLESRDREAEEDGQEGCSRESSVREETRRRETERERERRGRARKGSAAA
jgi:hypothetical protein